MNKKSKFKNLVGRSILFWAVVMFYLFIIELMVYVAIKDMDIMDIFSSSKYWMIGFSAGGILMAGYYSIKGVYGYMKSYNEEPKEKPFWLESRQLKRLGFKITDWTKTGANTSGHVIGVEEMSKGPSGIISNARVTAVLGCLEGAAAKAHLGFNLDKWQSGKTKPTLFIFDTQKEVLNNYNVSFEEAGYSLIDVDFNKPAFINYWNPFTALLEKVEPIKELTNGLENKDGKYQGAGETFQTYKAARERLIPAEEK